MDSLLSTQHFQPSTPLSPDFVVVGHLTRDESLDGTAIRDVPRAAGYTLGGTATYGAITARNLGYRAAVLTHAADNIPTPELLDQIQVIRLPSATTTTFRNEYTQGKRRQFVRDVAPPIRADEVPTEWRAAKIALLGAVANEIESDVARAFDSHTLVGVVPQGWMRQWDETGRVRPRAWNEAEEILPHARVLVLSEEDLGEFTERLQAYIALTPIVVLTRGARGCTVFQRGRVPFDSRAFAANEFDPTGAGDVFTAAFLIRLHETGDVVDAARFANCTASFVIEAEGTTGIPTRAMVQERLATDEHPAATSSNR